MEEQKEKFDASKFAICANTRNVRQHCCNNVLNLSKTHNHTSMLYTCIIPIVSMLKVDEPFGIGCSIIRNIAALI